MSWVYLIIAGAAEITWATAMKASAGFSKLVPSIITIVFYIASAIFLSLAMKKIPLGTVYAMWTGIGIIGTSILGVLMFNEVLSWQQVICIILIAIGIIGLHLLTPVE